MYSGSNIFSFAFYGLALVSVRIVIWSLIDMSKYEDWVWTQAGQNKALIMILTGVIGLVGCFCCYGLIGFVMPAVWFLSIKKKLDQAQAGGFGGYPPMGYGIPQNGYPPQGYPPGAPGYPPPSGPPPMYPPASGPPPMYPPASGPPPMYPPGSGGPSYPPPSYPGYPPADQPPPDDDAPPPIYPGS